MALEKIPDAVPSDDEAFPFGMWKGTAFKNVPASYLDKLMDMPWIDSWPRVVAYIEANRKVIDAELELGGSKPFYGPDDESNEGDQDVRNGGRQY